MLFEKRPTSACDEQNPLEAEKTRLSDFAKTVKLSSSLFTVSAVLCFAAAIVSFMLLPLSFGNSTYLAVIGAIFTVLFLALGLVINSYTKKESDFLCKVKRRPLGYLMRAKVSRELAALTAVCIVIDLVASVTAFVLYANASSWTLLATGVILILAAAFATCAFCTAELSRRFILNNLEFFDALETNFAKKAHII